MSVVKHHKGVVNKIRHKMYNRGHLSTFYINNKQIQVVSTCPNSIENGDVVNVIGVTMETGTTNAVVVQNPKRDFEIKPSISGNNLKLVFGVCLLSIMFLILIYLAPLANLIHTTILTLFFGWIGTYFILSFVRTKKILDVFVKNSG